MPIKLSVTACACLLLFICCNTNYVQAASFTVLDPDNFRDRLGEDWEWARDNVPFFESDHEDITAAYFFRWQVYRKHIKFYPDVGFIISEFLPNVSWAGPYNSISATAGYHIYEGRWLRDHKIMDNYTQFWVSGLSRPREYTSWLANAMFARFLADGRLEMLPRLLPGLVEIYKAWEASSYVQPQGCFYSGDTADGGEDSISGDGCRVSINAIMYGELVALGSMQALLGRRAESTASFRKAELLQDHVTALLWHPGIQFLATLKTHPPSESAAPAANSRCPEAPEWPIGELVPVRESLALSTLFFFKFAPRHASHLFGMWDQLWDPQGFAAEWGPRTAELRSPHYNFSCEHPCTWNGPSWPFETCRLIAGLANYINDYPTQALIGSSHWFKLLAQYARVHTRSHPLQPTDQDGTPVPAHPWIGEDIHPDLGYWIARDYLIRHGEGDWRRGYAYLHSTFCDLVITGMIGLRPRPDSILVINPLVPDGIKWFAIDNLSYHGRNLCIFWDETGRKYSHGPGFYIFADGRLLAKRQRPQHVRIELPMENLNFAS